MKSNKQYTHPGFLKTREETESWLESMGIENYTINDGLIVNVSGGVWIIDQNLDYIPVQFGLVDNGFYCFNNNLTSLEHCPTKVNGYFYCSNNMIVSEIPKGYNGQTNLSCETNNLELISSRSFDKFEELDSETKIRVLNDLRKLEPEFYNSAAFQVYNPDSILKRIKRSIEVTGGLFEL